MLVRWLASSPSSTKLFGIVSSEPYVRLTDYQREIMKKDPVCIVDFAKKFVPPICKELNFSNSINNVYVDAWRSVNGRPFQRWFEPDVNLLSLTYQPVFGFEHWLKAPLPDINDIHYVRYLDQVKLEWESRGFRPICFADEPNYIFEASLKRGTSQKVMLLPIKGDMLFEIYNSNTTLGSKRKLTVNKEVDLPLGTMHSITTLPESENSVWCYLLKKPILIHFAEAIGLD